MCNYVTRKAFYVTVHETLWIWLCSQWDSHFATWRCRQTQTIKKRQFRQKKSLRLHFKYYSPVISCYELNVTQLNSLRYRLRTWFDVQMIFTFIWRSTLQIWVYNIDLLLDKCRPSAHFLYLLTIQCSFCTYFTYSCSDSLRGVLVRPHTERIEKFQSRVHLWNRLLLSDSVLWLAALAIWSSRAP